MGTGVSPKRIATSSSYPVFETVKSAASFVFCFLCLCLFCRSLITKQCNPFFTCSSLERRWSSRTFRYGYLVTTSPQLSVPPSAAPSVNGWVTDFGRYQLPWCDGRCVQDPGTYSPRHSDSRLLAFLASCILFADYNPTWDFIFVISLPSQARFPLFTPL